jgi:hypothetical protein
MRRRPTDDHTGSRLAAAVVLALVAVGVAGLLALRLSLGLGLHTATSDDGRVPFATVVADDAVADAVLPITFTLFVAALVTIVVVDARLRPSLHRGVAARDRSPPPAIGC